MIKSTHEDRKGFYERHDKGQPVPVDSPVCTSYAAWKPAPAVLQYCRYRYRRSDSRPGRAVGDSRTPFLVLVFLHASTLDWMYSALSCCDGAAAGVRIRMFAMCPFDAIAAGTATFCSQNYGAGDMDRIREGYRIGCVIAVIYGIMSGACLILFGRFLCLIFLPAGETQILDAAAHFLRYGGSIFWMLGLLNVTRLTVQGLGGSGRAVFSGVYGTVCQRRYRDGTCAGGPLYQSNLLLHHASG